MNEVEQTAICLIIINNKPLLLRLKISPNRNQIRMPETSNRLQMLLESFTGSYGGFPGVKPLHRHNQLVIHNCFVRRSDRSSP
ncbi:hypothetical protein HanPI659440_Chr09g0343251 [Helianthus annuus]|nr:hypothetical protein HanPI659440_Chr09g0343251 [Helianthus annuus]